ncbi:DNA topoisomerase IB [Prauserella muralis]|uniref:DNA topoisomerase n=1 Tax=Prauserella muralis TaxID=588067 RepID=A0A2V4B037_9PSEU|nr:DNA topoisomerase IB [Prauserella muralis]PXY27367.1 DNA topoisomerase [Prauserella muralis]TWE22948.1 DNA topoisomerase IB [Prauserella muralis]
MRLRRSELSRPGIRRRRQGRHFRYLNSDGSPLTDPETLDRVRGLVVPPAWRRVWISPDPLGHIQAVGFDDAGRRQYLYHPEWRRARDEEKHDRVLALAGKLPAVREEIVADLRRGGVDRRRMLAAALRMIDRGVFRTGGEEYAEANGSRGATTLLREHVRIRGDELTFRYPAKGGLDRQLTLRDRELAEALAALRRCRTGSRRLFVCRNGDGWHELRSGEVNEHFKELAGPEFTVKDLRTWNATVLAAVALACTDRPPSQRGRRRAVAAVMREVAEELGNTPAVARRSYVDPRVVTAFEEGRTVWGTLRRTRGGALTDDRERERVERAVARLVRRTRR